MAIPKPHGALTVDVADALRSQLAPNAYQVLCGHGQLDPDSKTLGKLHTWFGTSPAQASMLADLDIAVIERSTHRAILLAEIEETTDRPKVLIGDAVTVLLGHGVSFQGRQLGMGEWTTLVIAARQSSHPHTDRLSFLQAQVTALKAKLSTPNAGIGHVVLLSYVDASELQKTLMGYVQAAKGG